MAWFLNQTSPDVFVCVLRQVSNPKGRKAEIQLVNALCILGASLEGFAGLGEWFSVGYVFIFALGRYGIYDHHLRFRLSNLYGFPTLIIHGE